MGNEDREFWVMGMRTKCWYRRERTGDRNEVRALIHTLVQMQIRSDTDT